MAKRPPSDYLNEVILDKPAKIKAAERALKHHTNQFDREAAENQLIKSARAYAYAVNKLVGRDALTDNDIEAIINQAKKAAGL